MLSPEKFTIPATMSGGDALRQEMTSSLLLFIICGIGVMVLSYLLIGFYIRRNHGVQPGLTGLFIMVISMVCALIAFYGLKRFGLDLLHGRPRDIFWIVLGLTWLVLSVRTAYERQSSGTVLMDLGPSPMFKLQIAFAVLMGGLAVGFSMNRLTRSQAFAHLMWSVWFFVMARGRFQVRDRGIITGGILPWKRIARCTAKSDNMVRLNLNNGLQRAVDLKLPSDRRDEFIQIVNLRKGTLRQITS